MRRRPKNRVITLIDSPRSGARARRRAFAEALGLANWMNRGLTVLVRDLDQLRGLVKATKRGVGEIGSFPLSFITTGRLATSGAQEAEMVIVLVEPDEARRGELSEWKRDAIERSESPVLLLPSNGPSNGFRTFFECFLVPMSGEARANLALSWAISAGNDYGVPVDVLHVTGSEDLSECDPSMVGHVSDQFYHEYPQLVDQFISEASPYSTADEKRVIRSFTHCGGEAGDRILKSVPRRWKGLLVLEWKGSLGLGRAKLVKRMLGRGDLPVLLVRHGERGETRLKVGRYFEAA